ncbi:MAG: hypothetical protein LBK60_03075 [Verrucomicrobiales bacterium]|jgi:hypothetical protein|nr:hypothetical protein [Verrucomicrobiales bacterium]
MSTVTVSIERGDVVTAVTARYWTHGVPAETVPDALGGRLEVARGYTGVSFGEWRDAAGRLWEVTEEEEERAAEEIFKGE